VDRKAELTVEELDVFLGLLILKGCTHKGAEKDFWSTDPKRVRPVVFKMMTRNRFMDIKRGLHCQPDSAVPSGESGLPKVGLLFDMFLSNAREVYVPDQEMALDEQMLKFKGKSKFKHYRQQKPIREGLKLYTVNQSGNGYVFDAVFDERNKRTIEEVTLTLCRHIRGVYRTLYMDNLFASSRVLVEMLRMRTYGCGTCRKGKGLPAFMERGTCKLTEPGTSIVVQGPNYLTGVAWFDSGVATALSTAHDGFEATVKRKVKGHKDRLERKTVDVFEAYNAHMGAVDQADQMRAYITARLRAFKWWHPVFYWILDSACINAFALWKDVIPGKTKMRDFIDDVIDGLFESRLKLVENSQDEEVVKAQEAQHKQKRVSGKKKIVGLGLERLLGKHFPVYTPQKRKRCVLCCHTYGSNSKMADYKCSYYCELCEKHLHLECFGHYHTKAEPKSPF